MHGLWHEQKHSSYVKGMCAVWPSVTSVTLDILFIKIVNFMFLFVRSGNVDKLQR